MPVRGLSFKLFLEGVLVTRNVRSVSVAAAAGGPLQVTASLPPFDHRILSGIKPRTHVAVFYQQPGAGDAPKDWLLAAEGEVAGYGHGKSDGLLHTDISIASLDDYWSSTYALQFRDAQSSFSTSSFDGKLVFGTNGAVTRIVSPDGRTPVPIESTIAAIAGKPDSQFPQVVADLLAYSATVSEFFKDADARLAFSKRLAFLPDAEISKIANAKKLQQLMGSTFQEFPEDGRLLAIVQAMLANASYAYQSMAMPSFSQGAIRQFIMKPVLPFMAPPRCNVIFPSENSSWSFRRSFMAEPTRMRYTFSPVASGPDGQFREMFFAPEPLKELAERIMKSPEGPVTMDGLLLKSGVRDESREDVKGVIPALGEFQQFDMASASETSADDRRAYLCGLVEHDLALAQHRPRVLEASMPYSPDLACGFPGLLIDQTALIFGEIVGLSHTLTSDGSPMTTVAMDTCREEDLSSLPIPAWKNVRYADPKRIDETYTFLLGEGHGSILAPFSGVAGRHASQVEAAEKLRKAYDGAEDKGAMAAAYRKRPIATMEDVFRAIGARHSGADYRGSVFREDFVAAARKVAAALASVAQGAS